MNLLNNIFNYDEMEIVNVNKRYIIVMIIIVIIIIALVLIKKDNYYSNTFTMADSEILLLVEKDYINRIQKHNKIIIDNIENDYSIMSITPIDNIMMVKINTKIAINNINNGVYKIYLGKERLFDYFIRIIRKEK